MKRDWELLKTIMLTVETGELKTFSEESCRSIFSSVFDPIEKIFYHLQLACDAGWITVRASTVRGKNEVEVTRITFEGHEFISVCRQPEFDSIANKSTSWHSIKNYFKVGM